MIVCPELCEKTYAVMSEHQGRESDEGPRGTIVIVSIFGALVVLGWLALFFGVFVPRGTP